MSLDKPPIAETLSNPGPLPRAWAVWMMNLWVRVNTLSGVTADRPTKDLFVGRQYYDTTLSKPIWLSGVRPTVWRDAAGVAV